MQTVANGCEVVFIHRSYIRWYGRAQISTRACHILRVKQGEKFLATQDVNKNDRVCINV